MGDINTLSDQQLDELALKREDFETLKREDKEKSESDSRRTALYRSFNKDYVMRQACTKRRQGRYPNLLQQIYSLSDIADQRPERTSFGKHLTTLTTVRRGDSRHLTHYEECLSAP